MVLDYERYQPEQREEREPQQRQHEQRQQDQHQLRVAGAGWSMMAPSSLIPPPFPAVPLPPEREPPGNEWHGHPLFIVENLYRAYRRCRRRKRNTGNALAFERDLEAHLLALHNSLENGTYLPRPSLAFLVTKPKCREIFAADFHDRVVHHLLVGYLEVYWERHFIHDSYACRRGKGTLHGVERLRTFTRKVTANGTRRSWYLQLDKLGVSPSVVHGVPQYSPILRR